MAMSFQVVLQLHRHHLSLALSEDSANTGGPYEASIVTSLHCATKVLAIASASYELLVSTATIEDLHSIAEALRQGILVDRAPGFIRTVSEAVVRGRHIVRSSVVKLTSAPRRQLTTYTIITRCQRNPGIDTEAAITQLEDASEAAHKWLRRDGLADDLLVRVMLCHVLPDEHLVRRTRSR
jgi:hypothetical protein